MRSYGIPDVDNVTIRDEFWSPRQQINRESTIQTGYQQLVESGRLENLRLTIAGQRKNQNLALEKRMYRDESDIYKWLEAASYALSDDLDPDLEAKIDYVISLLEEAQQADGYLNSYFTLYAPEDRWTNLGVMHELYNAGHLFEAAVAHHEATGEDRLLDIATAFADHIHNTFSHRHGAPGHQEIELALVKLYRVTDSRRYLDLAAKFLDERGREESIFRRELKDLDSVAGTEDLKSGYRDRFLDENGEYDGRYVQDHKPVREQSTAVGHAVRATYMYCGMADVAMETDNKELVEALERIWTNTVNKRMYITGGLGNYHGNEGFTSDYDLPNDTAYAETCAAIGNIMWNHRMLQLTGEGKYGDLMERVLYNGFLVGMSLDGTQFFYVNPLESNGKRHPLEHVSQVRFTLQRQNWFGTPCCPPNVARFLGSFGKYLYFVDNIELSINLYVGGSINTEVDGSSIEIKQRTDYPWGDTVEISVSVEDPIEMTLRPRIPGWCSNPTVTVNGRSLASDTTDGYVEIQRTWADGDELILEFPMPVTQIEANPKLTASAARVALQRGPVIYCFEGVDNEVPLESICFPADVDFSVAYDEELLDGVVVVRGEGLLTETNDSDETLYRSRVGTPNETATVTAIPYYAWANREKTEMRVWMRACNCEN